MSSSSCVPPFPLTSVRCLDDKSACPPPSYIAVSGCIYSLPAKKHKSPTSPEFLSEFYNAKRLFVSRLPETATQKCVNDALSLPQATRPDEFPLRVLCSTRRSARSTSPHILVAPSEELRQQWYSVLLWSISPVWLLKKEFSESVPVIPASVPAAGSSSADKASSASSSKLTASRLAESPGISAQAGLWVGAAAPGIAEAAGVASAAAARALGGVAVVGPALQVVVLAANCARMIKAAEAGRGVVETLHGRLVAAKTRLEEVAGVVRMTLERTKGEVEEKDEELGAFRIEDLVEDIVEALVLCWDALVAVELYMMNGWVGRIWNVDQVEELTNLVDKLDDRVQQERLTQAALQMQEWLSAVENNVTSIRDDLDASRESRDSEISEIRDRFARLEEASDLEGSSSSLADSFFPGYATVRPLPRRVVRDGCPHFQQLKSFVLSCGSVAVTGVGARGNAYSKASGLDVFSAEGEGGLGKTTACLLVAHDPDVRRAFPGGVYFFQLTPDSRDADVASALGHIVRDAGGRKLAHEIKHLSQPHQVQQAVDIARKWFENRRVLVVADNIWRRSGSGVDQREWAPTLAPIAESPGSAFLFSTRDRVLSKYADESIEFDRLDIQEPEQRNIARRMFERYAGIRQQEPSGSAEISQHNDSVPAADSAYLNALPAILDLCDGWPLAIEAAGSFARNHHGQWAQIVDELSRSLVGRRGDEGQRGLEAIWEASISFAEKLSYDPEESHNPLFCEVNVRRMRKLFGKDWLTDRVAALSVFDAPRSVPLSALAVQHGTSLPEAAAFLRLCAGLGFGKLLNEDESQELDSHGALRGKRHNVTSITLALHDLQFSFVQRLCRSREDSAPSLHEYHRELLVQLSKVGDSGSSSESAEDWSMLVKSSENAYAGARKYFARKLVWHFCNSFRSDSDGERKSRVFSHEDREWSGKLCRFLCDFRWIQFSGALFGRQAVLESWSLFVDTFCLGEGVEAEPGESKVSALSKGEKEAVITVFKVLEATSGHLFSSFSREECPMHGRCDSGLAGQLEGRLSFLSFETLSKKDQEDAFAMVEDLLRSVRGHASRPRLSPRGKTYGTVGEKDRRCTSVRYGGHGSLNAVAFIECPGRSLVASACSDGLLRVHDMNSAGETVVVLAEEDDTVGAISVKGSAARAEGALIAAAYFGGIIRVWRVQVSPKHVAGIAEDRDYAIESAHVGTITVADEFILQFAWLMCVSFSDDWSRVVAGFNAKNVMRCIGGDERLYAVNVWTLGSCDGDVDGQGDLSTVTDRMSPSGADARQLLLLGHRGDVNAVWISRDGKTVVSASDDESVRVWRVPLASNTKEDYEISHVVYLGGRNVRCLAAMPAEDSILAGTRDGFISILCLQSGDVQGLLSREDKEEMSKVRSMALVECIDGEASGRSSVAENETNAVAASVPARYLQTLFCGHENGTISQWSVEQQTLLNEYGTPWGGSGAVVSLAAQTFGEGEGARKVHLVSGYGDGRLREWDTEGAAQMQGGRTVRGVREARSGHHIPRSGGLVVCTKWSPGNNYLVFGREIGHIELSSISSNAHICTLFGHEECVQCLDFTLDDKLLGSVDGSTEGRVWDTGRRTCISVLRSPDEGFSSILFVGGSAVQVMTGGTAGSICIWNTKTAECVRRFGELHRSRVEALALPMDWEGLDGSRGARRGVSGGELSGSGLREGIKAMITGRQVGKSSRREGEHIANAMTGSRESEAAGISRDSSGLRRVWNLQSGAKITSIQKSEHEDTGMLLSRELSEDCVRIKCVQYREARNIEYPRIFMNGDQRIGAEYSFVGDAQTEAGRVLVSFFADSYTDLFVRLTMVGAAECRCQVRLAHGYGIYKRSTVCRLHWRADGRPSVAVGFVDFRFKVIFFDVLF